ncbi:MAG: hypothetical protein ACOYXT_21205 [Bacteroidota bacterium]
MKKRKRRVEKELAKRNKVDQAQKTTGNRQEPVPEEEEKPFDFGGIPDCNLKKNLGCG